MNRDSPFSINLGRFLLGVLAAFLVSGVLFTVSFFVLPVDMASWQFEHGRVEGDPLMMWGMIGHFLQSVVFTLIFFLMVRSNKSSVGIVFGVLMGAYLVATDLTVLAAFEAASATFTFTMIPVNLIVGVATGYVLTLIYRGAQEISSEPVS